MKEKKRIGLKKKLAAGLVMAGIALAAWCAVLAVEHLWEVSFLEMYIDDWLQDKSYGESDSVSSSAYSDAFKRIRFMGLQQMLEEEDGSINENRPALVVQLQSGEIRTYSIGDLIRQGEEYGIFVYEVTSEHKDINRIGPVVEENAAYGVHVLWCLWEIEDAAVEIGADVWTERQYRIREAINQAQEQDPETVTYDDAVVLCTDYFLTNVLQNYYDMRRELSRDSNFQYQIVLKDGEKTLVYSDAVTERNGETDHKNWDVSYYYNSESRVISSQNLSGWERDLPIQYLRDYTYRDCDSVTLRFGLNTENLIYEDHYRANALLYGALKEEMLDLIRWIAVALAAALVGMIWLIPLCGHRDGEEEIVLNWYDRIPTELGAVGILLLGLALVAVFILAMRLAQQVWYYESFQWQTVRWIAGVIAAILAGLIYLILWLGFYGLIRRIKARTIWKNSICAIVFGLCLRLLRRCGRLIRSAAEVMVNEGDAVVKTALIFAVYVVAFLILATEMRYDGFFVLLLILLNVVVGIVLLVKARERKRIRQGVKRIAEGNLAYRLPENGFTGEERQLVKQINHIGSGLKQAMETSVKNERMKTELITNVSHDIKTPLTSIINYVDLMKREEIENEKLRDYLEVLEQKSQRLKSLTEDLVEASKASAGTLSLYRERIDFVELVNQTTGEFSDRFEARTLNMVTNIPEKAIHVMADGRYVWRILENLYRNAEKYSMPGTRVYIDVFEKLGRIYFVMKNVSHAPLNIKAEELTERFVRGDESRTTEGSGLGLSIAKDMTELMEGTFRIYLDGDLFRVTISFPILSDDERDPLEEEKSRQEKQESDESLTIPGEKNLWFGKADNTDAFEQGEDPQKAWPQRCVFRRKWSEMKEKIQQKQMQKKRLSSERKETKGR